MKDKRQIRTKLAITTAAIGLSSAAVFGLVTASLAASQANKNNASNQVSTSVLQARGGLVDVAQPYIPTTPVAPQSGVSPSVLYHLPVIEESAISVEPGDPLTNATRAYVTRYYNNLASYKLLGGQFGSSFRNAALPITTSFNDPVILEQARAGLKNFSDIKIVGDNFDELNGIGSTLDSSRRLKITLPEVRDVLSADFNGEFVTRQGLLTNDTVSYQVAEINLKELATAKSLAFEFKDNADSTFASKHNFRIIISNENDDIKRFVDEVEATPADPSNPSVRGSLTSLINSRTLFVRDIEQQNLEAQAGPIDATTVLKPQDFGDKVIFTYRYDETRQAPILSILVQPTSANGSDSTGIDFGIDAQLSDASALAPQVLSYGLLDTSVSPRHTKVLPSANVSSYNYLAEPIDLSRALTPQDPNLFYTNLPMFRSTSRWGNIKGLLGAQNTQEYNLLRLFLMQGSQFIQPMQFRGKSDQGVFADLDNNFRITYNASDALVIAPREIGITKEALDFAQKERDENGLPAFNIDNNLRAYSQYHNLPNSLPTTQYAQVDVALAAGVIQFNYDNSGGIGNDYTVERPYSLGDNVVSKIFFEDPFTLGDPVFTNHTLQEIKTIVRPDVFNRDTQLISEIVRNWSGFETDPLLDTYIQPNATYFNNAETGRFAATADSKANFNSRLASQFSGDGFAYTYKQYAVNAADNSIQLINTSATDLYVGRYDQDLTTMAMKRDAGNNLVAIEAGGKSIYDHFIAYNNALTTWSNQRFDIPLTSLKPVDDFKLTGVSVAESFTKSRLLDRGGEEAIELGRVAKILVRLWIGDLIPVSDQNYINDIFTKFERAIPGARALIEGRNNGVDTVSTEYKNSKQVIFYLLQPYLVRVLNRILDGEVKEFEKNRLLTLGKYFGQFLTGTNDKTRLAANLTGSVTTTQTLTNGMDMLAILRYGVESATNGVESIRSIFNFISTTKLQARFLNPDQVATFEDFAAKNFDILDDPDLFTDPNLRASFAQLMSLTSSILSKTLGDQSSVVTLNDVTNKLLNGQYDFLANPNAPVDEINTSVNSVINVIGTDNGFQTYEFYGSKFRMSFLETLVIGRNLTEIITQYIKLHDSNNGAVDPALAPAITDADRQTLEEFLAQQKQYNVGSLFNFMVSRNITVPKFFANSLTALNQVENTALEYLQSNIVRDVNLIVDSNIQELKTYGNVASLSQYFLMAIGAATVVSGIGAFAISFRRATRSSARRSIVLERSLFVLVAVVGIALIIIGVVFPGIL